MHTLEAIAGIALITFIGVVWVALLLAADSARFWKQQEDEFGSRAVWHGEVGIAPNALHRNATVLVNVLNKDVF